MCMGWRRHIWCPKLQVISRKRATNYRAHLRKMTYKDKASYGSPPHCTNQCSKQTHTQTHTYKQTHDHTLLHMHKTTTLPTNASKQTRKQTHTYIQAQDPMGWLWLVGSIKSQVFFAKQPYKRDNILQKRPII